MNELNKNNNNGLYNKIIELNDYVIKEYGYDPNFDFDILEELTIYTANLIRMGIFDFKLVIAIGEVYALNDIANGKTPPVDVEKEEGFKAFNTVISDAMQNWFATHPNEKPVIKDLEMILMFSPNANFSTKYLMMD